MENILLSSLLLITPLTMLMQAVFPNYSAGFQYSIIFIYLYIFFINKNNIKINKIIIAIYGVLIVSSIQVLFQYLDSGYAYAYIGLLFLVFIYVLPCTILGYNFNYESIDILFVSKLSFVITLISYIYLAVNLSKGDILYGDLGFSYGILPAAMISWKMIRNKFNLIHILNFILVIISILLFGSRGPLLCLIIFILFDLIKNKITIKVIISFLMVVTLGLALYNYYGDEYSSRTLDKIQNNTLFTDTGRFVLQGIAEEKIVENPFTGIGIGGERVAVTKEYFTWNENGISNLYPHNFFIEVLSDYGVIFGTFFILSYIYLVGFSCKKMKGNIYFIFLLFFSYSFIKLMVSDSYLQNPWFFFSLGYMLNFYDNNKIRSKNEEKKENINT